MARWNTPRSIEDQTIQPHKDGQMDASPLPKMASCGIYQRFDYPCKNLQATILFVDFTKALDWIHRGKMEKILLAYDLTKENVAAIMILYRNTKVKVHSPDKDTDYIDIVAGVLQGDALFPYLFIICLDYVIITFSW